MKRVAKVDPKAKEFQHDDSLFTVYPKKNKTIWTLYKRFRRTVKYRVLSDVKRNVPVGVQRQKAS
jgi:hypothetical protein